MRRVAPSVFAREDLHRLVAGGSGGEVNVVSAFVEAVTRLVIQELVEGEQADFLGGRGHYERRDGGQVGSRNGYEPGRLRTAEGAIDIAVPQVRGTRSAFRSSLLSFLEGNSEVLDRLVTEMYARGLSTRDVEDAFRDATGELLISRSAVSEITDRLWEDYQAFITRDLSEIAVEYLFVDAVFEALRRHGAKEALLVAWCIDSDGRKHLLPLAVGNTESEACWVEFFRSMLGAWAAAAHGGHLRRRPRSDQGDRGVFQRLDPDPLLVPQACQHPRETARGDRGRGDGASLRSPRRTHAGRGPGRRGPVGQHLRS